MRRLLNGGTLAGRSIVTLRSFSHPARVVFHLDGGFTRSAIYLQPSAEGAPLGHWDIRTASIPPELRAIGSRLRVSGESPDPNSAADEIRAVLTAWQVTREN
jgi:hypothetical protein